MVWQDIVFAVGGFIFAPALVFAIRARENKPPIKTSLPTAIVLTVYLVCYGSIGYWLAVGSTTLTALAWYILVWQERGHRNALRDGSVANNLHRD